MNWTCVVYGGAMTLVLIWWFVSARKWFKGPKVNVDHLMLGRDEATLEGQKETDSASSTHSPGPSKDAKVKAELDTDAARREVQDDERFYKLPQNRTELKEE